MVVTSKNLRVRSGVQKIRDEKLFIGTLGVNCLKYTRKCIETVETSCSQVMFCYIDNGSNEENVREIKSWKKKNPDIDEFNVAFNHRNAGVAFGWNQLIKIASGFGATKILICNNDIHFGPYTIDGMVDSFNQLKKYEPKTVMVTATNHTKNPSQLPNIKQVWKWHEHPDFSCFMIEPDFVDKVGFFDVDYDPAFFEDNDKHWRILMTGYKAFGTDWAPYSHIASRTRFENPHLVPHIRFRENKIKFFKKNMTDTVDQSVADARYENWIKHHPECEHPSFDEVMKFSLESGLITKDLIKWLEKLNTSNVPN